jgi:hypothetical protein
VLGDREFWVSAVQGDRIEGVSSREQGYGEKKKDLKNNKKMI